MRAIWPGACPVCGVLDGPKYPCMCRNSNPQADRRIKVWFRGALVALLAIALAGCHPSPAMAAGPGTEATRIINRMGLGADCGRCRALAAQMDAGGPRWVLANRGAIARQMVANADALGHRMGPVRRLGVRVIIRRAVRASR